MTRRTGLISLLCAAFTSVTAWAGPAEDAIALVYQWSATYSANDPDALVNLYAPDAVLLGTVSPVMSEGTGAIKTYFARLKGSGNTNTIGERRVMLLSDDAVIVTGFYEFVSGPPTGAIRPSRFTMLVTRRDAGGWRIAHHHSSPLAPPPK